MSPSPIQVVKIVAAFMKQKAEQSYVAFSTWNENVERARDNCSKILEVPREGVWFVNNTSEGMNIIANGVKWKQGDNVVMPNIEFPSNVYPFLRRKGQIDINYVEANYSSEGVSVPIGEFEKLVNDNTRVVCVSAVDFGFGIRFDLREISDIAHRHGAMLVVDASQSAGVIQMHGRSDGIDVITLGGQKWTLAPSGGGILYMSPEILREFEPPSVGWNGVESPGDQMLRNYTQHYELAKDARKFALGHLNFPGIIGLKGATDYLLRIGISNIEKEVMRLTRKLIVGLKELRLSLLSPDEDRSRAGIVSFGFNEPAKVVESLMRKKVLISGAVQTRGRGLRVSPNFYNTDLEIDSLLTLINKYSNASTY